MEPVALAAVAAVSFDPVFAWWSVWSGHVLGWRVLLGWNWVVFSMELWAVPEDGWIVEKDPKLWLGVVGGVERAYDVEKGWRRRRHRAGAWWVVRSGGNVRLDFG